MKQCMFVKHTAQGTVKVSWVITEWCVAVCLWQEAIRAQLTDREPESCSGQAAGWAYIVAVEGVEDSGDVAAQDANGNPRIIQRHPAAAGLLRAVATEQVITHRTQHTELRMGRSGGVDRLKSAITRWQVEKYLWFTKRCQNHFISKSCADCQTFSSQLLDWFFLHLLIITANILDKVWCPSVVSGHSD